MVDISVCWAFILFNHYQESRRGVIKIRQVSEQTLRVSLSMTFLLERDPHFKARKRRKIMAYSMGGNAGKHFIEKINERKRQCIQCKKVGKGTVSGRPARKLLRLSSVRFRTLQSCLLLSFSYW